MAQEAPRRIAPYIPTLGENGRVYDHKKPIMYDFVTIGELKTALKAHATKGSGDWESSISCGCLEPFVVLNATEIKHFSQVYPTGTYWLTPIIHALIYSKNPFFRLRRTNDSKLPILNADSYRKALSMSSPIGSRETHARIMINEVFNRVGSDIVMLRPLPSQEHEMVYLVKPPKNMAGKFVDGKFTEFRIA